MNIRQILPELNPSFFDPLIKKDRGVERYLGLLQHFLDIRDLKLEAPLQYRDRATQKYCLPKVYLVKKADKRFKVRICNSDDDAHRISHSIAYATSLNLPVSQLMEVSGPFIILEYLPGREVHRLRSGDLEKIALLHRQIGRNIPFDPLTLKSGLINLAYSSSQVLSEIEASKRYLEIFEKNMPLKITPIFDHQDFGFNNLIRNEDDFFLIDEEAFGILPFGYTLHRTMYGRRKYRTCDNESQRQIYLSTFDEELVDYYRSTQNFWESIYRLREGARILLCSNKNITEEFFKNVK